MGRHPHFSIQGQDGIDINDNDDDDDAGDGEPDQQQPQEARPAGSNNNTNGNGNHSYPPNQQPPTKSETPDQDTKQQPSANKSESNSKSKSKSKSKRALPQSIAWVSPHLSYKGLRPVIRASISAWIGVLILVIPTSEKVLGQASFLVLIVATICPAATPIASTIEQTVFEAFFVGLGWAWACLGILISHAARTKYPWSKAEFTSILGSRYASSGLSSAEITLMIEKDVFHGEFLEPASSAVSCIFLSVGVGFLLWLRGNWGPGPYLFGLIFGIIILSISLTISPLFPYPYYSIGLIFFLPFVCQLAINLVVTFLVFPETLAHQFSDRLISTLTTLHTTISLQKGLLSANPRTADWLEFKSIKANVTAAMAGLTLLGASEANLTREVSWARVSGKDLNKILGGMRVLVSRSTGFVSFYEIVEKHLHRDYSDSKGGPVADALVIHLGPSRPASVDLTPISTRAPSVADHDDPPAEGGSSQQCDAGHLSPPNQISGRAPLSRTASAPIARTGSSSDLAAGLDRDLEPVRENVEIQVPTPPHASHSSDHLRPAHKKRARSHHRGHHSHHHHGHKSSSHISLTSLLHEVLHPNIDIRPVGIVESQRYMDLEDYLHNPRDEEHIEEIIALLSKASSPLIDTLAKSVDHLISIIHNLKSPTPWSPRGLLKLAAPQKEHKQAVKDTEAMLQELEKALATYRDETRLDVVRPFACLFDPVNADSVGAEDKLEAPSHRGLFWAFSYQFSLLGWSTALVEVFKETAAIEKKRKRPRIWTPEWAKFKWASTSEPHNEDESPSSIPGYTDRVPGFDRTAFSSARSPDYVLPSTPWHLLGIWLYDATQVFSRSDFWFAVKATSLIAIMSIPAFFQSSTYFYYRERGIWVLIMAALTSTQYVGDTTFNFVIRVFGTFAGAVIGMVMWYIGAGKGTGSPYGIAAVAAVCLPFIMFYRIYYQPVPTAILPAVTCMLVLGYSWQNANQPSLSSVGWGWDIAWRRFVCVLIGITAAWLWAYLPPRSTQKETVRKTYAKVIGETGGVLCQILSFANCKDGPTSPPKQIVANLAALRAKVSKAVPRKAMIRYEVSIRGAWPVSSYDALQNLQMEILDQMGQLLGVLASLDTTWTRALLHRAQLDDPRFLGEVLNTFQLISTALTDSKPLPMIYNPLLELFLRPAETLKAKHAYGYDVSVEHALPGIPLHVDLETISSIEYLRFSCGISQCYAIINRLDRLMLVAKSLVGESYIVYGLTPDDHLGAGNTDGKHPNAHYLRQQWLGDESRRNSIDSEV
ncbi:hypothetical protein T439DRAFT_326581 [Meredithblackwellia eburnea MCA 4105]